jgi:hypothetical protein
VMHSRVVPSDCRPCGGAQVFGPRPHHPEGMSPDDKTENELIRPLNWWNALPGGLPLPGKDLHEPELVLRLPLPRLW